MPYADPEVRKQSHRLAYERRRQAKIDAGYVPRSARPKQTAEEKRAYHREWNKQDRLKDPEKQRAVSKRSREKHFERRSAENRAYERANPHKLAEFRTKTRYGITRAEADAMEARQNGQCLICEEVLLRPAIDHCHTTLKVRGILCKLCNAGLGMFKDRPEVLERAAAYLRENG